MYTLVKNDEEFFNTFPDKTDEDLPMGYPCLVKSNRVGKYHPRYYIYISPNVKCIDSFIAGVNAVC